MVGVYTWRGIDVLFHFAGGGLSGKQNRRSPDTGSAKFAFLVRRLHLGSGAGIVLSLSTVVLFHKYVE